MSDEYADRFVRPNRPTCFGDVETYDSKDPRCQSCPVRGSCSVQVNRKIDADARGRGTTGTTVVRRDYSPAVETRPRYEVIETEDDSWFEVLGHNGALGAVEAMARELVEGIRGIPRKKYPNPFAKKKRE